MTSPDVLTQEEEKQVGKEVRGVLAGPKLAKFLGPGGWRTEISVPAWNDEVLEVL